MPSLVPASTLAYLYLMYFTLVLRAYRTGAVHHPPSSHCSTWTLRSYVTYVPRRSTKETVDISRGDRSSRHVMELWCMTCNWPALKCQNFAMPFLARIETDIACHCTLR
ncbi:hypothetical protein M430DRAFT_221086 [Amorphotheca resinae ATCC 22711]|uniref:Uncharacterized protein n=1 Tax=Amorphotheca resinae ATCC 22711 TaxID=857342 RepID=A0A2T3B5R5_AMORE|nr:hypothetical protein M430DRAFT_221086 [Amorphotheca resinae ATCC 22711]PSS22097.1 hypothetical protein M430DRAFT_221086 [Amorphotheca resinae ATCC 22711]